MAYRENYEHLIIEKNDGIALLTINRPESLNSTNFRLHYELSKVWLDIADDPAVRVAVITGAGRAFSAGGDFDVVEKSMGNLDVVSETMKEARDIVHNMINCDKPIISAINGVAVGAGLAVALLADISIASEKARFTDGHTRLGVAAGGPCRGDLAPAGRHGKGQILFADMRHAGCERSRADWPGQHGRPTGRTHAQGDGGRE